MNKRIKKKIFSRARSKIKQDIEPTQKEWNVYLKEIDSQINYLKACTGIK